VFGFPAPTASINREALRKDRVMNSSLIAGARGVNRIEAFLDSHQAAGLREVNAAELQGVEGGLPMLAAVGAGMLCFGIGYAVGRGLMYLIDP
jgi:hypothetical protein